MRTRTGDVKLPGSLSAHRNRLVEPTTVCVASEIAKLASLLSVPTLYVQRMPFAESRNAWLAAGSIRRNTPVLNVSAPTLLEPCPTIVIV